MTIRRTVVLLAMLAGAPAHAGDDLSLDALLNIEVTTASKKAEKLSDAPGVISVVTADEIERYGARTLLDVLDFVTGTTTTQNIIFPTKMQGIRGDDSERSNHQLLLINGRPARRSLDGGFSYPLLMAFPVDTIERVEVIRGPGSVLYGSTAYQGVVNVITKQTDKGEHDGVARAGAGNFSTAGVDGAYQHTTRSGLAVSAGGRYLGSQGYTVAQPDSEGQPGSTQMNQRSGAATFTAAQGGFSAFAVFAATRNPSFGADFVWDGIIETNAVRFVGDLGYGRELARGVELQANFTYNHGQSGSNYPTPDPLFEGLYGEQASSFALSNDYVGEVTLYLSPSDRVNWLFGGVIERQTGRWLIGEYEYVDLNLGVIEPYANDWFSAYTQFDARPIDPLKLVVGAQLNKPEGVGADLVPRLGVIANASDHVGFKVLSGQAFRSAYTFETSFDIPTVHLPNPALRPEKITTLDAQVFGQWGRLQAALTGFQSEQEGLMQYAGVDDPNYRNQTQNQPHTLVTRGVEFELKAVPVDALTVIANVSAIDAFELDRERPQIAPWLSTSVPVFWAPSDQNDTRIETSLVLGKLGASYRHEKGLTASVFGIVRSASPFMRNADGRVTDDPNAPFVDLNLRGQANLSKLLALSGPEVSVGITGTNVLDQIRYEGFLDGPYQMHAPAGVWGDLAVTF